MRTALKSTKLADRGLNLSGKKEEINKDLFPDYEIFNRIFKIPEWYGKERIVDRMFKNNPTRLFKSACSVDTPLYDLKGNSDYKKTVEFYERREIPVISELQGRSFIIKLLPTGLQGGCNNLNALHEKIIQKQNGIVGPGLQSLLFNLLIASGDAGNILLKGYEVVGYSSFDNLRLVQSFKKGGGFEIRAMLAFDNTCFNYGTFSLLPNLCEIGVTPEGNISKVLTKRKSNSVVRPLRLVSVFYEV
ncbi:MAG TPA: hypothetical protein VGE63_02330 [Candidatus Paceibacterota bacterium]